MLTKAIHYCAVNASNRRSQFLFSLTSITGETDKCDSPFTNTPAEEELASDEKKQQKERLVGYQGPVNIKEEYTKTKTGIYGRNSDRVKKNV